MDEFDRSMLIAELQSSGSKRENEADKLGLKHVWAYHCSRCNYVWLPKDFDFDYSEPEKGIFLQTPPKSCARCKSKYWRRLHSRNTKTFDNDYLSSQTLPRLRAQHRQGTLRFKVKDCDCQYCKV